MDDHAVPRITTIEIVTASGLSFTADVAGPADGPLVLLLHGFPESRHTWRTALPLLAAAGYRAVAPDQRGYSPGARPDPADLQNYAYVRLVQDALEIADAISTPGASFDLVGHDWGGQVAWGAADAGAERVNTLTVLSRPHPGAFRAALQASDGEQRERSRHHRSFLEPDTGAKLLDDNARRLRATLSAEGVPAASIDAHLGVLGSPDALEAALAWYRANAGFAADVGTIAVPTLYVWGDADATVGRAAASATAGLVDGEYHFEILPDVGHFVMDQAPAGTTALLLSHLARHHR